MPIQPISQFEYVTYARHLEHIADKASATKSSWRPLKGLPSHELVALREKISFINAIHLKLKACDLKETTPADCAPLAAERYNTHLKTIAVWNRTFNQAGLQISLPNVAGMPLDPAFEAKSADEIADDKALNRYLELLTRYPKLKREGDLNDYTKGTYQIIYDPQEIKAVQQESYHRLYNQQLSQGLSPAKAHEMAVNFSRPGVVAEDRFWIWIRDVVISPQHVKHTYNRMVWKSDLERVGGAATMPIIISPNGIDQKIVVQLAFRHATGSWEFEMPRGTSKTNETSEDTARREMLEETGYLTNHLLTLGSITPDSGLVASIVPIFMGKVTAEMETRHDKTEAIKGKYAFSYDELAQGFKQGYIEVALNGEPTRVNMRDPFLAYALLLANFNQQLP